MDVDQYAGSIGPLVPAHIGLKELGVHRRPGRQHLSRNLLAERDPEAVHIADDDLAHAVEHVVRTLDDLDVILDSIVEVVDVLGVRVEIDLTTVMGTKPATRAEHDFACAERHHRKAQAPAIVVVGDRDIEPDLTVPVDGLSHVWHVEHWYHLLLHDLPPLWLSESRRSAVNHPTKTVYHCPPQWVPGTGGTHRPTWPG